MEECDKNCNYTILGGAKPLRQNNDVNIKNCETVDIHKCIIKFEYFYQDRALVVRVQQDKICPEPINILGKNYLLFISFFTFLFFVITAWIIGVFVGIVLVGITVLVAWKVYITLNDRREYAKFESERDNTKWQTNQNPLYKNTETRVKNPMFGRMSRQSVQK